MVEYELRKALAYTHSIDTTVQQGSALSSLHKHIIFLKINNFSLIHILFKCFLIHARSLVAKRTGNSVLFRFGLQNSGSAVF